MLRSSSTTVYGEREVRRPVFPFSEARMGFRSGMSGLSMTDAGSGFYRGAFLADHAENVCRGWDDYRGLKSFVIFRAESYRSRTPALAVSTEAYFSLRSIPPGLRNSQGGTSLNPWAESVLARAAMSIRLSRTGGSAGGRDRSKDCRSCTGFRAVPPGRISDRKSVLPVPFYTTEGDGAESEGSTTGSPELLRI
jgi:hypothetical protein